MSEDSKYKSNLITVNQCLFGYDDGHRLLSSSSRLSSDAHSLLLLLSDLVPGIKLTEIESYWTGVPLRDEKQYALMRTWPAKEMSRPGCVWTHVILVSFADVARIVDLSVLQDITTRPIVPGHYENYGCVITLNPGLISQVVDSGIGYSVSPADAFRLIRAIYSDRRKPDVEANSGELDEALFAIWSQQWPRLRRSFAFRTAASKLEGAYPGVRFDLRLLVNSDGMSLSTETLDELKPWETIAVDDILNTRPTDFRRFLWRYGSDINGGREIFQFLADIYLKTRVEMLKGKDFDTVLEMVAKKIPVPSDGFTLKEDLVACGRSKFSLLPPGDELDTLAFFVNHPEIDGQLPPPIEAYSAIHNFWPSRSNDILILAERAAEQNSEFDNWFLNNLAKVFEPTTFLALTKDCPNLRQRFIPLNPTLLLSKELVDIPLADITQLLDLVPDNYSDIINRLLTYLLLRNDAVIVKQVWTRFPRETLEAATEFLRRAIEENGPDLPSVWRLEFELYRSPLLNEGVVENARSTRFLAGLSDILGYDSPEVLSFGPKPWINALQTAVDDVYGHERQTFLAFLLALVIRFPVTGSELIFERAFEVVHNDIWNSCLSTVGLSILRRHLPDIGWLASWDNCKRLRIAVVSAYVDENLDPMSFRRLTTNQSLLNRLIDLASETKRGRQYIKRISM